MTTQQPIHEPAADRLDQYHARGGDRGMTDSASPDSLDLAARERIGRRILAGALVCGIAGDFLTRGQPISASLVMYVLAVSAAIAATARSANGFVPRQTTLLLFVALIFATPLALRDAEVLALGNLVAVATALALAGASAARVPLGTLSRARVRDALTHIARGVGDGAVGSIPFWFRDAQHALRVPSRRLYATRLVARAVVLGLVATIVFGALLASGDPVFAGATSWFVRWNLESLVQHLFFVAFFSWPVIGFLRGTALVTRGRSVLDDPLPASLNRMDVLVVLGSLNVLFTSFVLLQLRALFGGQAYVLATTGLTLAEYARSGFFTLVVTAGLVLVVLLALNALLRDTSLGAWRTSRRLAQSLSVLVGVVMASAATRMALYVDAFGPSADRVYASAAIVWVGALFFCFSLTVLRDRPRLFLLGSAGAAWATLLALNVASPEQYVLRRNLERAAAGAEFDLSYATTQLGADAVPGLVEAIAEASPEEFARFTAGEDGTRSCDVVRELLERWGAAANEDGTGWNLARSRARQALVRHEGALQARACERRAAPATVGATPDAAPPATESAASPGGSVGK
jgi:hypothetical protein